MTDPDARMARKSHHTVFIVGDQASVLTEIRRGLTLGAIVSRPHGLAEAEDALVLSQSVPTASGVVTVVADNGYDTALFAEGARALGVTPHVAAKSKGGALDGRTTRLDGSEMSQRRRKAIEEVFGWLKTVAGLRKLRHRSTALVDWLLTFACAAYSRGACWPPERSRDDKPPPPRGAARPTREGRSLAAGLTISAFRRHEILNQQRIFRHNRFFRIPSGTPQEQTIPVERKKLPVSSGDVPQSCAAHNPQDIS